MSGCRRPSSKGRRAEPPDAGCGREGVEGCRASTVYNGYNVSKVMVSLPQDLVDRLDRCARDRGTSRSGLLRELAERELARQDRGRVARAEQLLGEPGSYGGRAAGEVRRMRNDR
jgi:Ribbon-helix-helix protein, copG family